jgi:hypothetical protein
MHPPDRSLWRHSRRLRCRRRRSRSLIRSSVGTDGDGGDNIDNANHTAIGFCPIVSLYAFTDETQVSVEEKEEQ